MIEEVWRRLEALLGEWRGEGAGEPGRGAWTFSFSLARDGQAIVRWSRTTYPSFVHEDLMVVRREVDAVHATYLDSEGNEVRYRAQAQDDELVFTSDEDAGPRFRLRYQQLATDRVRVAFEIAQPGMSDFRTHVGGEAIRTAPVASDVAALRRRMVDVIVEKGYLKTPRIEEAFRSVPRHLFLPTFPLERVYSGEAIPTRHDDRGRPTSSSSEPAVMAVMLEQLGPAPGQRWLEIGAGSGYNAAIVSWLVRPGGEVTTIEVQEDVAREARDHLEAAGFSEVRVVSGDGWRGLPEGTPYDRIELTASIDDVSPHWVAQLAPDGRLLAPLHLVRSQALVCFRRLGERLVSESIRSGGFMALQGEGGWSPSWPVTVVARPWSVSLPGEADVSVRDLTRLLHEAPRDGAPIPLEYAALNFLDLALEDAMPVSLFEQSADKASAARRPLFGVFDPSGPGLAAANAERFVAFGAASAEALLRRFASEGAAEDRWSIEALPAGATRSIDGARILPRRHHDFVVRMAS